MNILLANNRFFISGGPERYMFTVMEILEQHGHTVIPFSNNYDQNVPTPYSQHFMPAPTDGNSVYYREFQLTPLKKVQLVGRASYSFMARRQVTDINNKYDIDVAYFLAIANYLSPSIIDACYQSNIPVFMRLSDFNLLCPAYLFLRDGRPCQECVTAGLYRAVVHRCLQDSALVSLARVISMSIHQVLQVYDHVTGFIAPSRFLLETMVAAGFDRSRFHHIPSPVKIPGLESNSGPGRDILYFGRIAPEKGLEILIKAYDIVRRNHPDVQLVIAGERTPEQDRLEKLIQAEGITGVRFLGFVPEQELGPVLANSLLTVCPSLWFENTPMSVYESLAHGKPVIASDIGSLPEQISHGVDGLLFDPGDVDDLAEKLSSLLDNPRLARQMGMAGRERMKAEFSPEMHYEKIITVFQSAA